jgi:endo-1,4-beta-xylanase
MNARVFRLSALLPLFAVLATSPLLLGCGSKANNDPDGGNAGNGGSAGSTTAQAGTATGGAAAGNSAMPSLAEKYADFFPIGAAIGNDHLNVLEQVIAQDFNHLTCENAMKAEDIHASAEGFYWADADRVADFARQHGMKMTGHALLWHLRTPDWMFEGVTAGDADSLELLKTRLKDHIEAMIERYDDVVSNWDVVNEVISDNPSKEYRDGSEGSKWHEVFGSEEYVYWAFKYAKDALEAKSPTGSAGKLYYNEYSSTIKADRILKMLAWLKDEKGIQIDGVGFQGHEKMTWPSIADLQIAFDKFRDAGYKIKISELDVSVYDDYVTGSFVAAPALDWTSELEDQQAKRFADLFALYRKNKDIMTSVTFWGVSDDMTWLDTTVPGRNDYPLIYNDAHKPKAARAAIMDF